MTNQGLFCLFIQCETWDFSLLGKTTYYNKVKAEVSSRIQLPSIMSNIKYNGKNVKQWKVLNNFVFLNIVIFFITSILVLRYEFIIVIYVGL